MGRKQKNRRKKKRVDPTVGSPMWLETDGVHAFIPGDGPSEGEIEEMNRRYQESIRRSPLWSQMVEQFGEKKAEELLRQCKVEVR